MDFPGHFQHIFSQLNHQRLHAQLCDCIVVVGDQTFRAHRSILAACSSHFRALISSCDSADGGSEADTSAGNRDPCVMALDPEVVTPEAFSILLDMIYTSTLSLEASSAMDVLLAASHLHLNTVVKACKLHLSRKNFPTSAPKGWRSVKKQCQCPCSQAAAGSQQLIILDLDDEEEGEEVSQSGGDKESCGSREQSLETSLRQKRKSEDRPNDRKRFHRLPGANYKERSPTVTRSTEEKRGEETSSQDSPPKSNGIWGNQGFDEDEEKYEAMKGESEEVQLPTQSDSTTGGTLWGNSEDMDGNPVVKVKVGKEEEEEELKMQILEVKKENVSAYSSDPETLPNNSLPSPLHDCTNHTDVHLNDEKVSMCGHAGGDLPSLHTDGQTDAQRQVGDLGEVSVDGEGLDSLSELAFSCFLNPSSEMDSLEEEEDSLASLTAVATAAAAASDAPTADEQEEKLEETGEPSTQPSDSSSLVFPVTNVPLQQFLQPTQNTGFSDTIILQPTQNSFTGFLSGIGSGLSLENAVVQPARSGKSSGTTFRRIAPKVPPGSESVTEPAGEAADRPTLTKASEDVLSKCKKAAAEDHVLLVEGEKKYACKICCKTFMNLTDCKKHIRVHTGEKPYPCQKCGKRFSQSSHLYKHSKNTCLNWKEGPSFADTLL
ncbi:zinc finger and BTB domain-containing protein 5 [Oryzias latipes]|uniref:Zinc finger and BTB domain containing 5 n=1 Tax=Oryzias latipes TaxID=8090 RepID=H2LHZ8_ORYLA|nr:zinc finger and BTB domain-containing protein 5 [Oryzias latipes]